jgi:hypothetical protein
VPAGDLITADWQVELRGTLTGAGTPFMLEPPGLTGLGVPNPKTNDVDRMFADGMHMGRDYAGVRVVNVAYTITATAAEAGELLLELDGLWAVDNDDVELHARIPGFGHIVLEGRPRGLLEDARGLGAGIARALATFWCGNPAIAFEDAS